MGYRDHHEYLAFLGEEGDGCGREVWFFPWHLPVHETLLPSDWIVGLEYGYGRVIRAYSYSPGGDEHEYRYPEESGLPLLERES